MGWASVLLAGGAAVLLFISGHIALATIAIITAAVCFWSWGVMHNYAAELARRRSSHSGGFYDITNREAERVPDWIAGVNLLFSLASLVLFLTGIVLVVWR